jgi:hypothetical protein
MMTTTALMIPHPGDARVTMTKESVVADPDEHWVADVLVTLERLRAEKTIDLDRVLCVAHGCFTYAWFGGMAHLPTTAVVLTINRSYAITLEVERSHRRCEGVLVSCGNQSGGFVFSINRNHLRYEYHCAGALYTIGSDREIPVGASTLRFVFTRTGHLQGIGTLYINDEQVGKAAIPHTLPYLISSEEPDGRRGEAVGMRQSESDRSPSIRMIKGVMISSADNPEPIPGMGPFVFRTE